MSQPEKPTGAKTMSTSLICQFSSLDKQYFTGRIIQYITDFIVNSPWELFRGNKNNKNNLKIIIVIIIIIIIIITFIQDNPVSVISIGIKGGPVIKI